MVQQSLGSGKCFGMEEIDFDVWRLMFEMFAFAARICQIRN
jgi:hypothetical protein